MKKLTVIIAIWLSLIVSLLALSAYKAMWDIYRPAKSTYMLPDALFVIGKEAFANTAVETIVFPDSLSIVGERAFAGTLNLKTATIPESVEYIGKHAFYGSPKLVIRGAKGSYAEKWAQENNVAFIKVDGTQIWSKILKKLLGDDSFIIISFCCADPCLLLWRQRKKLERWRSMRPQDRKELYPINYKFP